jgi:voltage-gated potassium channel
VVESDGGDTVELMEAGQGRGSLRDRYNQFVHDHDIAWELIMAAFAAAYVVIGFAQDDATGAESWELNVASVALSLIFAAEFTTRILAAYDRPAYLRGHWIDLLAVIPAIRYVRLLRLARLLRLIRMFAGIYRALSDIERLARHRTLIWLFVAWLAVAVICSIALYIAESGVNPNIHSPFDALWWGIVTLSTVGYGDVTPVTPEGRFAGAALMILGITLFAAITGTITSFLIKLETEEQAADASVPSLIRSLGLLRDDGFLTSDEFESKKHELLARI